MGSIHTQTLPKALAAGAPPQTPQKRGRALSVLASLIRRVENGVNPRTTKLFQLTFAAKGGVVATLPPGFWSSRPNFFVKFFMGIVSGSRNPKVVVRFFYLYHVTLKLKVIDLERDRVYFIFLFYFNRLLVQAMHIISYSITHMTKMQMKERN